MIGPIRTASAPGPACEGSAEAPARISHPDEEAVAEVALEIAVEDLRRCQIDVVLDALELELTRRRVVHGVTGAVVVVARLPDRTDADDVLETFFEREVVRR